MHASSPTQNISIRPATRADVASILAVQLSAPESAQWSPAAYMEIFTVSVLHPQQTHATQRMAWCALFGEQILGFAVGACFQFADSTECELENMAVNPAHRRSGCGRMLVEALLSWAHQQSASRILLEVRASNTPAISLYQKLGFHSVGRRKNYYSNPVDDAVLMTLIPTPNAFSAE